jgi:hypothetical protein
MLKETRAIISSTWGLDWSQVQLVSGGAAWGDHLAVQLYKENRNKGCTLKLCLPCGWDVRQKQYVDRKGDSSWRTNPGRLSNTLHSAFSKIINQDTTHDLHQLIQGKTPFSAAASAGTATGCDWTVYSGFFARNDVVAKSNRMIAFTWDTPQKAAAVVDVTGGTGKTWGAFTGDLKFQEHRTLQFL